MRLFNDDELHKDPFEIFPEDVVGAAPVFNVIDLMKMKIETSIDL